MPSRSADSRPPFPPSVPVLQRSGRVPIPLGAVLIALVAWACGTPPSSDPGPAYFRSPTPHEAHRLALYEKGLAGTVLGEQWIAEAGEALANPLDVPSPYAEEGRFVKPEADAVGYRLEVERGQRLEVRVEGELARSGDLLVDLYRVEATGGAEPVRIRSLEEGTHRLDVEPDADGTFVLRIQPVLFGDGRYRLSMRTVPALAFPVEEHDNDAVWSRFGAPRDGGSREHHGVDIFAPRGTPVVAAADAYVRRVDETPVGGKVVWLRDRERGQSLYYAHLDSQVVRRGDRVQVGDTVGMVGNTGNARTTPPHLHFGIYARGEGPIDPFPFIRILPSELPGVRADRALTGSWARAASSGTRLRARPETAGEILGELEPDRAFRVVAASGEWYRVRFSDGSEGFVAERVIEDLGVGMMARAPTLSSPEEETPAPAASEAGDVGVAARR